MQVEMGRLRDFVAPDERGVNTRALADGSTAAFGLDGEGRWVRRENPARAAAFSRRTNPRVRQAGDDEAWGARRVVDLATEAGMLDEVPEAIKVLASRGPVVAGAPPLLTEARRDHGRKLAAPLLAVADRGIIAASRDLKRVHVALDIWPPSDKGDQRCFFVGNAAWSPPGVARIVTEVFNAGVAVHGPTGDSLLDYIDQQLFARGVPQLLFLALGVEISQNADARDVIRERFRLGTVLRDGIVLRQSIVFAERTVLLIAGMESCLWSAWAKFWVTLASNYLRADWQAATLRSNQARARGRGRGRASEALPGHASPGPRRLRGRCGVSRRGQGPVRGRRSGGPIDRRDGVAVPRGREGRPAPRRRRRDGASGGVRHLAGVISFVEVRKPGSDSPHFEASLLC